MCVCMEHPFRNSCRHHRRVLGSQLASILCLAALGSWGHFGPMSTSPSQNSKSSVRLGILPLDSGGWNSLPLRQIEFLKTKLSICFSHIYTHILGMCRVRVWNCAAKSPLCAWKAFHCSKAKDSKYRPASLVLRLRATAFPGAMLCHCRFLHGNTALVLRDMTHFLLLQGSNVRWSRNYMKLISGAIF